MVLIIRTERLSNPNRLFIGIICDIMKVIKMIKSLQNSKKSHANSASGVIQG